MTSDFSRLARCIGYCYKDSNLLERALSHRSVGKNNNERLEFLGDSVLSFIISQALFERFPNAAEGQLSQMRATLVKGKTLAAIARGFSLGDFLILGSGEMKSGGHRRDSILADTLEALIGAMYIDGGIEVTRDCVLNWFATRLDAIVPSDHANKDAKTRLQEWLQAERRPLPEYTLVGTSGNDHQQQFEVLCLIALSEQPFSGRGSSRRAAEQQAAGEALAWLQRQTMSQSPGETAE